MTKLWANSGDSHFLDLRVCGTLWAAAEEAGLVARLSISALTGRTPGTGSLPLDPAGRAQLRRDHLRGPAGGHQAGRPPAPSTAIPTSRSSSPRAGDLGALPRRPHERGLPPARDVRAAHAVALAQRDPLPAGVRLVPARRVGSCGHHGHGLPERDVGQRLPSSGRTYGHSQKTLHELFDGLDPAVSDRIRVGAFKELFPHVSDPPE